MGTIRRANQRKNRLPRLLNVRTFVAFLTCASVVLHERLLLTEGRDGRNRVRKIDGVRSDEALILPRNERTKL